MRIITGKFKGRRLAEIEDRDIRPATDRVRGSIFNMLQNRLGLVGAIVLDLFAGTGSLGFEAISRGAAGVTFVDTNDGALEAIGENAARLQCEDAVEVVRMDSIAFARASDRRFDLIFADPPYAFEGTPEIPALIFSRHLLKKGGFLIIEHMRRTMFPASPAYLTAVRKDFGGTAVSFFVHSAGAA